MRTSTAGVERGHEREATILCPIRCPYPFARFFIGGGSRISRKLGSISSGAHCNHDTTADNGGPLLQPAELVFNSGQYYRLTIDCPDVRDDLTGWRIEMPEFLNNAHLRLVTVGDIEVHLQGLSFNAIECDEVGAAHVSFVPIKPGAYPLYVGNVPLAVGRPIGEAGVQRQGKFVFGTILVQ